MRKSRLAAVLLMALPFGIFLLMPPSCAWGYLEEISGAIKVW